MAIGKIALVLLLAVGVGFAYLALTGNRFDFERRDLEWASLVRSVHAIEGAQVPDGWGAALYVSKKGIGDIVALLDGTTVRRDPEQSDDDTVLTVGSVTLQGSDPGFPTASITVRAESKKRNLEVGLTGEIAFAFEGFLEDKDHKTFARFSVQPLTLEPSVKWYSFAFGARGYAGELIATGAAVAFAKALRLDLPVPALSRDLTVDKADRIPTREPNEENWIDLNGKLPTGLVTQGVSFSPPVFIEGGVWFGARLRDEGQVPLEVVTRDGRTPEQLDAEIAKLRETIRKVPGPSASQGDVALWVSGGLFAAAGKKLADLPPEARTLTVVSTAYAGKLSEQKWRDDILGEGGSYVELNKPDAVHATVALGPVGIEWLPGTGVSVSANAHVEAKADLHVHVDPLIGGGAGTNIGLVGAADAGIAGALAVSKVAVGTATTIAFVPKMQCNKATVSAATDGKFVTDLGWTKVPSVGIRVETAALANLVQPSLILSDLPVIIAGRAPGDLPLPEEADGIMLLVTPVWKSARVSFFPLEAAAGPSGLLASIRLVVSTSDQAGNPDAIKEARKKLATDLVDQLKGEECPSDTSIAVTIGNTEFGSNNDLVKFFRNAFHDLTKGTGTENEVVKGLTALTNAMKASNEIVDDATKGLLNEINGQAAKAFGEHSVAANVISAATTQIIQPPSVSIEGGKVVIDLPIGPTIEVPLTPPSPPTTIPDLIDPGGVIRGVFGWR